MLLPDSGISACGLELKALGFLLNEGLGFKAYSWGLRGERFLCPNYEEYNHLAQRPIQLLRFGNVEALRFFRPGGPRPLI